jgi:tRNA pseudouridine32 synthase/23S rRNA pseudouridine746 synthase
MEKTYWAIADGAPPAEEGRIELPLGKRSKERGWWMKPDPEGQPSITDYRVIARGEGLVFMELHPRTGRTHQLRVHLAALGCPVLGDAIYGRRDPSRAAPLQLHARAITVPLYPNREAITATAPPPLHMLEALARIDPVQGTLCEPRHSSP